MFGLLALTRSQIQVSIDVDPLLDIAADCLQFVTEFFEVISLSGSHIYHSALLLAPSSSMVRKLYGKMIRSPVSKIVTGIPTSWDSCTASAGATTSGVGHAVWSPCGQFVAVGLRIAIEIRDSNTLERLSNLNPPGGLIKSIPHSLAFSPNGRLLACIYLE